MCRLCILPVCEWVGRGGTWIQTVKPCQNCLSLLVWWSLLPGGLLPFSSALFRLLVLLFRLLYNFACISACSGPCSWIFYCPHIVIIALSRESCFLILIQLSWVSNSFPFLSLFIIEKVNLGQILDAVGAWQIQKTPILFPVCHRLPLQFRRRISMFQYITERNIQIFFIVPLAVFRNIYLKYINIRKARIVWSHAFIFHSSEQLWSGVLEERCKHCSITNKSRT